MIEMTGISMAGKMSVGVFLIEATPPMAISSAITTKVYGRLSAVRIIHIGGVQCAANHRAVQGRASCRTCGLTVRRNGCTDAPAGRGCNAAQRGDLNVCGLAMGVGRN